MKIIGIEYRKIYVDQDYQKKFMPMNVVDELDRFLSFYNELFGDIEYLVINEVEDLVGAISRPNRIELSHELFKKPYTLFFKYILHECIHQFIGLRVKFTGRGALWLKESLTEYIQLYYLKLRFGTEIYNKNLDYYYNLYNKYLSFTYNVSISEYHSKLDEEYYLGIICGKGVLLFHEIFGEMTNLNTKLKLIFSAFDDLTSPITIDQFKIIVERVCNKNLEYIFDDFVRNSTTKYEII